MPGSLSLLGSSQSTHRQLCLDPGSLEKSVVPGPPTLLSCCAPHLDSSLRSLDIVFSFPGPTCVMSCGLENRFPAKASLPQPVAFHSCVGSSGEAGQPPSLTLAVGAPGPRFWCPDYSPRSRRTGLVANSVDFSESRLPGSCWKAHGFSARAQSSGSACDGCLAFARPRVLTGKVG